MIEFDTPKGHFLIIELPYKAPTTALEMLLQSMKPVYNKESLTEDEKTYYSYVYSGEWKKFPYLLFDLREHFSGRIVGEGENEKERFDELISSLNIDKSKNYMLFKK